MRITFDPARNVRGLPIELVAQLDWATTTDMEDMRRDYGERRCACCRF